MVLVFALLGSLIGCGPNCRSSCERLYGSGEDQCNINVAGFDGEEGANRLVIDCLATCNSAMSNAGSVGSYDPNTNEDDDVSIANEKQAALWMDCVQETSCENIDAGYCLPHE